MRITGQTMHLLLIQRVSPEVISFQQKHTITMQKLALTSGENNKNTEFYLFYASQNLCVRDL
jgi:hypothetical protein